MSRLIYFCFKVKCEDLVFACWLLSSSANFVFKIAFFKIHKHYQSVKQFASSQDRHSIRPDIFRTKKSVGGIRVETVQMTICIQIYIFTLKKTVDIDTHW